MTKSSLSETQQPPRSFEKIEATFKEIMLRSRVIISQLIMDKELSEIITNSL